MSFRVVLQVRVPLSAHERGAARTTPGAVVPLAAPLRRGKAVPGQGGEDNTARPHTPAPSPEPLPAAGSDPVAPRGNRWSLPGTSESEERAGRGAPLRLRYLTPPGVPASMAELPRATPAETRGGDPPRQPGNAAGPKRDRAGE